jgi:UDP-2,3-diacylglucosamine hydrolase
MTVLFVADIHLSRQRPDLIRAFVSFLEDTAKDCRELYLIGDIFEAWIGDDYLDPILDPVTKALQNFSARGSLLYFQQGNRDFLVNTKFTDLIGAELLPESLIVKLPSTNALVMHGDQLCTDDTDYQDFRTMVRSPQWQQEFLRKPIDERLQIAEFLRNTSKEQTSQKSTQITDVNRGAVVQAMQNAQVELLIHGHTHRPNCHELDIGSSKCVRMVLGDWDTSLWYIKCDTSGCKLIEQKLS